MCKSVWYRFQYNVMLKNKLILTYFIIVFIPIIILGTFLTNNIYEMTISDKIKTSNVAMNQIKENIAAKLLSQKNVIDALMADINFMNYINTYYEDDYLSLSDYTEKVSPIIEKLNIGRKEYTIKIYSKNRSIKFSGEMNNSLSELQNELWFKEPENISERIYWKGAGKLYQNDKNNYLVCYRVLRDYIDKNSVNAVIAIFQNENNIYSLISEEKSGGNMVFLFDDSGNLITSTEKENLHPGNLQSTFKFRQDIDKIENGTTVKYNNNSYLFLLSELTKDAGFIENWKIVYMVPAGGLLGDIRMIWITSVSLAAICLIISLIIIFFVSGSINKRISNLLFKIKRVFEGDLKAQVCVQGSDEIAILQNDFNSMVKRLDTLINEVYQTKIAVQEAEIRRQNIEVKQKKAEIKALQRQINPHYLINTLESIRMNLVLKGDRETAKIIKIFAESFKKFVYEDKKEYTIREEIDFIDKYITIQNYRFVGKIKVEYNIDDEILDLKIPKFIIQPLVENAISHGIEINGGDGKIEINISKVENVLNIMVSDNGAGIDKDKLDKIKAELENQEISDSDNRGEMGIALKNINSRIRLEYGREYGLQINSEMGKGTIVCAFLPINS